MFYPVGYLNYWLICRFPWKDTSRKGQQALSDSVRTEASFTPDTMPGYAAGNHGDHRIFTGNCIRQMGYDAAGGPCKAVNTLPASALPYGC